ncbi:MAG: TIGR02147 family protein [Bdellovibrionaceae bacterium]|nr:TIGR02147 family protein [Pseudobdellovibrionaceae bacterium]
MIFDYDSITEYLHDELGQRVQRNSRYSLRAFAKALSLNPAELSQVLKGQRKLSLNSAFKVTQAMGFTPSETKHFLLLLQKEKGRSLGLPLEFLSGPEPEAPGLSTADFERVCDWYHFAILNLLEAKNFEWSAAHISQRLGITLTEAKLAMRNLEKLGFVTFQGRGAQSAKAHWQVGAQIPSAGIRKYHRQILEKAAESLETVPVDQREFQGVGLVVRATDLKRLKIEIDQFTDMVRNKFHRPKEENVYQLEVALFPLTKGSSQT